MADDITVKFLSEEDQALLKFIIEQVRQKVVNTPARPTSEEGWSRGDDHQAPEVYIALTPPSGIPPLTRGTDQIFGGTSGTERDIPGVAECDIYQIVFDTSTAPGRLEPIYGLSRRVYNLSEQCLYGWLGIVREKFGHWIVWEPGPCPGTGTGTTGTGTIPTGTGTTGTPGPPTGTTGTPRTGTTGTPPTGTTGTASPPETGTPPPPPTGTATGSPTGTGSPGSPTTGSPGSPGSPGTPGTPPPPGTPGTGSPRTGSGTPTGTATGSPTGTATGSPTGTATGSPTGTGSPGSPGSLPPGTVIPPGTGSPGSPGSPGTGSPGSPGSPGTGSPEEPPGSGTVCATIEGVNFATLPETSEPDYLLGIKNGCLVKVPVSHC